MQNTLLCTWIEVKSLGKVSALRRPIWVVVWEVSSWIIRLLLVSS